MATGEPSDICDICNGNNKISIAAKWCPECEEKLCEECHINHSISKLSRHHSVIDIKGCNNIPDSILEIKTFCNQHHMKYSNFCPQHDKLCCPACTTGSGSHSGCRTLLIQDVIQTTNLSTLLKSMELSLKSLTENIGAIIKDRQTNIRQLQEQKWTIEREIKESKETILKKFDAMETEILKNLNLRVKQNFTQLESEVADLEKRLKISEDLLKSTTALVDIGSGLHTYIGSKTLEAEVARETNSLHDLVNSGSLKKLGIRLNKYSKNKFAIESDKLFGRIISDVSSVFISLSSELDKQAQNMYLSPTVSVDDVKLSLKSSFQIHGSDNDILGCTSMTSDMIVIANHARSSICILKENVDVDKEIQVSSQPRGVTVIHNNTLAISCNEGVKIINITNGETLKTISTGKCHGLAYYNGSLFCAVPRMGVISVDLNSSNMISDRKYDGWLYCTVHLTVKRAKHCSEERMELTGPPPYISTYQMTASLL